MKHFDNLMRMLRDLLAAIGLVAAAGLVGLYHGGFFQWLLSR